MKTILAVPRKQDKASHQYDTRGLTTNPGDELKNMYIGELMDMGWEIRQRNEDGILVLIKPESGV